MLLARLLLLLLLELLVLLLCFVASNLAGPYLIDLPPRIQNRQEVREGQVAVSVSKAQSQTSRRHWTGDKYGDAPWFSPEVGV